MRTRSYRGHIAIAAGLLAAAVLGPATAAHAQRQSGIQLSPDSQRYLISKDVGNDRWAISYNLADKTVTGNVLVNGTTPEFIACTLNGIDQDPNPLNAQYHLHCQFAQACGAAPCANQWGDGFDVPPIPGSFFLPDNTQSAYAGNIQPIYDGSCATSAVCHANGSNLVVLSQGVSYQDTFRVESNGQNGPQGPFITPFDTGMSYLLAKVQGTGAGARMPYNGDPLPQATIDMISTWILEGAANN